MTIDKEYMLEEYRAMYEMVKLHQDAIRALFRMYIAVLVVPFTAIALVKKEAALQLDWSSLGTFVFAVVLFIFALGVIIFRICLEHRLKTVLYIRCINAIRRYFVVEGKDPAFTSYPLLSTDPKVPPFFKLGKDFFWETTLI